MTISGGTPKGEKKLKIWHIKLGPELSTDILQVRTKDNAVVKVKLRYKWRFNFDKQNPDKIFAVSDFIGLMTETMASIIRGEAANHNFEDFHSGASKIIRDAVFGEGKQSYTFAENGMEILDIDIKEVAPQDPGIAKQLTDAIQSNMRVYVDKLNLTAKLEAEKSEIAHKLEIEAKKKELAEKQQETDRAIQLGKAQTAAEVTLATAKAETDATQMKKKAETDAEVARIRNIADALKTPEGEKYLKLAKIQALGGVRKIVIPADSRLIGQLNDLMLDDGK